jgi:hypothetical protein
MEQPPAHQVADVGNHRDVGVDDRVVAPADAHRDPADVQLLPVVDDLDRRAGRGELLGAALVAEHPGPGVAVQQRAKPLEVEVVGVLVGDQHGGQALQLLEPTGEGTRVQQQPGRSLLHQQARVSVLGQPHGASSLPL